MHITKNILFIVMNVWNNTTMFQVNVYINFTNCTHKNYFLNGQTEQIQKTTRDMVVSRY
jgi:hypothetical protein